MKNLNTSKKQTGAVLILALVFLAMTAMISSSVLNTSVLEVKMVGNAQFKEEAFQVAEGVLDGILTDYRTILPGTNKVSYTSCSSGSSASNCGDTSMTLPAAITAVSTGVDLSFQAKRLGPLEASMPVILDDTVASSAAQFSAALYETSAIYDGRDAKLGYQEVYEGIAVRVPANNQ
ncbi:MAG: pilus assembly PilX N-terminal domain-containing protein [Agarilytica sp.]